MSSTCERVTLGRVDRIPKYSSPPPILDRRYWALLREILQSGQVARELKQTVIRIPVLPTLASFLARLPEVPKSGGHEEQEELLAAVNACYETLLPLSVSSTNIDPLLACSTSYIASSDKLTATSQEWVKTGGLLCKSLDKLPNERNTQKKLSAAILDKALPNVLALYGTHVAQATRSAALDIVAKLLFSQGNLQRMFSQPLASVEDAEKCLQELFTAFKRLTTKDANSVPPLLAFLPDCFSALYAALQVNAAELFVHRGASTSSRSAAETYVQQQARYAVFSFLQACIGVLGSASKGSASQCADSLLVSVEQQPVYAAGPGEANQAWLRVFKRFASLYVSERITIAGLHTLARIDFEAVQDVLPAVLSSLSSAIDDEKGTKFIETAIEYYGKTRQLPHLLGLVEEALLAGPSGLDDADFDAYFCCPLLCIETRERMKLECSASLSGQQAAAVAQAYARSFAAQTEVALLAAAAAEGETLRSKKRKTGKGESKSGVSGGGSSNRMQELAAYRALALAQMLACLPSEALSNAIELSQVCAQLGQSFKQGSASQAVQVAAAAYMLLQASGAELPALDTANSMYKLSAWSLRLQALRAGLRTQHRGVLPLVFESIGKAKGSWTGYTHRFDEGSYGIAAWYLVAQQHLGFIKYIRRYLRIRYNADSVHPAARMRQTNNVNMLYVSRWNTARARKGVL